LKAAFQAVRDTIKKRLVLANARDKTWVSRDALDLVKSGRATLLVFGKWVGREYVGA
jgi:hypothetical protein